MPAVQPQPLAPISSPGPLRFAAVQYGNYAEALRLRAAGGPEPYFGMYYALEVLESLFGDHPHLMISLNAPHEEEQRGSGVLVGLPSPSPSRLLPATIPAWFWARAIRNRAARFHPTHLLLRVGDPMVGAAMLEFARRRHIHTLVILANMVSIEGNRYQQGVTRRFVELLNQPFVFLVGNHKQVATESLVACGVRPEKTVAWDWPASRRPEDYPIKTLSAGPHTLAYVGRVAELKGVLDLFEAVRLLQNRGRLLNVTIAGDGEALSLLRQRTGELQPGTLRLLGRIGNAEAFELMKSATLVCVPSRHAFAEAMPLALTEALASRTPVIASDHPVFTRAFTDHQGLCFFRASDPSSLASVIEQTLADPAAYASLSRGTAEAFRRVECSTTFGDLVARWKASFPPSC